MQDGYVKLISFTRPEEAHMVKSILESEGEGCLIANENLVNLDIFLSQAMGGVQLWVKEEDLEQATKILNEAELNETPDSEAVVGKEESLACPQCESKDTFLEKGPTTLTKVFFFFGIPLPFFKNNWKCRKCGRMWKVST
jgi:rubredoxin